MAKQNKPEQLELDLDPVCRMTGCKQSAHFKSIRKLQARVSELERLRPFIEEIWFAHRDKQSEEYNECEIEECCWCEETRKALQGDKKVEE